jgi:hypothetical protein
MAVEDIVLVRRRLAIQTRQERGKKSPSKYAKRHDLTGFIPLFGRASSFQEPDSNAFAFTAQIATTGPWQYQSTQALHSAGGGSWVPSTSPPAAPLRVSSQHEQDGGAGDTFRRQIRGSRWQSIRGTHMR